MSKYVTGPLYIKAREALLIKVMTEINEHVRSLTGEIKPVINAARGVY